MNGTGLIESWNTNPLTVGPIYPFAGYEYLMLALCLAAWLLWTFWQMRFEDATYEEETEALRRSDTLSRVISRWHG